MEEDGNNHWLTIILAVALIWAIFFQKDKYEGQTAEDTWESYNEMGEALDNLETVSEP